MLEHIGEDYDVELKIIQIPAQDYLCRVTDEYTVNPPCGLLGHCLGQLDSQNPCSCSGLDGSAQRTDTATNVKDQFGACIDQPFNIWPRADIGGIES